MELRILQETLYMQDYTKNKRTKTLIYISRRVARIWKRGGGGFFDRVRKVQTTLTRIFIVLESVSHKKLGNQTFFQPKIRWSPKKKRSSPKLRLIFRPESEIQTFLQPKNRWSPKKKKKKRFSPKLRLIFRPKLEIQTFFPTASRDLLHNFGTQFPLGGGLFSIFHQKLASKAPKTSDFAYFTSQWGRLEPPPLATLLYISLHHFRPFIVSESVRNTYTWNKRNQLAHHSNIVTSLCLFF